VAISLSIASYQYHDSTNKKIISLAERDIHDTATIEANAISRALSTEIKDISNNLRLLSQSRSIQNHDIPAQELFDFSQSRTSELTDGYYWIAKDGKIVTYSEINTGKFPDYRGDDLSFREYYQAPKKTLRSFVSTIIDSRDGVPRLYLSHPILDANGKFNGVIVVSISTRVAGNFVQSQLLPEYKSMVGLMDRYGLILYANNHTLIGKHYYDNSFQSILPDQIRTKFNSFLERSKVNTSETEDISYGSNTVTIASKEILINGEHSWTAYIIYPHVLTDEATSLLNHQRTFNMVIIATVGTLALLTSAIVLTSNKRLHGIVEKKTSELKQVVGSLAQANEQLREHDKLQQEFINIAAHELRTPITPIVASLHLAEMKNHNKPEISLTRQQYDLIVRNSKRLESLARNILDVSRIESGKFSLSPEVFDINDEVENVVKDAATWVRSDGPKIEFKPSLDSSGNSLTALVSADKTKIFEVLSNLLRNAIRFSSSEGIISVSVDKVDNDLVTISVKDYGRGIDSAIMPRLFQKFASSTDMGGTGLGLFISKSIVEAHSGKMWARNNEEGKGATFAFTLPLISGK
jgi:signal transduction histidine kinase